jgi:ElaB/YqjD/DUF883 family membrane-anchored ribosome-binding protein
MSKDRQGSLRRVRTATSNNVKRAAAGIGESAKQVRARAKAASEDASETLGAAKLKADRAAMEATRIITEHPLAAVAAAAAIGALAAGLLPRFMRPKREDIEE